MKSAGFLPRFAEKTGLLKLILSFNSPTFLQFPATRFCRETKDTCGKNDRDRIKKSRFLTGIGKRLLKASCF